MVAVVAVVAGRSVAGVSGVAFVDVCAGGPVVAGDFHGGVAARRVSGEVAAEAVATRLVACETFLERQEAPRVLQRAAGVTAPPLPAAAVVVRNRASGKPGDRKQEQGWKTKTRQHANTRWLRSGRRHEERQSCRPWLRGRFRRRAGVFRLFMATKETTRRWHETAVQRAMTTVVLVLLSNFRQVLPCPLSKLFPSSRASP